MKLFFPPIFKNYGVLGLNARNLLYIKPHNARKSIAFADDKLKTKSFLSTRGVPTAKVFAKIETRSQLQTFDFSTLPSECVLKPNNGFGGEGILILRGRKKGQFLVTGKKPISDQELREHIEDILDGKFSVSNKVDTAFFEQILVPHKCFVPLRPAGLPDIRIIVFNLVPVMAMLRIPTAESEGKANVHLGGVGIGIDMGKGVTTHAAQYHHIVKELPHGIATKGIELPYWDEMLEIAANIQHVTNIGYLAVDLTLDAEKGPMLLEVNARAGLMVQIANMAPLRARLERVQGLTVRSPQHGVQLAKELFGESGDRTKKKVEKPILGPEETITIAGTDFTLEEVCGIAPEQEETVFSSDLLDELLEREAAERIEETSNLYKVKFTLAEKKIASHVRRGTVQGAFRILIGRRDLQGFLIDPSKKTRSQSLVASVLKKDLRGTDRILADIDKALPVLKYLRPTNLEEELVKIRADERYEPLFQMRMITADLDELRGTLNAIQTDTSPLGILLQKKKKELLLRIDLLKSRGNPEKLTQVSELLFGSPSPTLTRFAAEHLSSRIACSLPPPENELISAEDAKHMFEKILEDYGLHDWSVQIKTSMVSDCAVGGRKVYVRKNARFSEAHIRSLIAHEIETHVLTAENGASQPYMILRRGCANYLDTQEGLAIWNQIQVLPEHHEKRYAHAKNVLGIAFAKTHGFADLRKYLHEDLSMSPEKAIRKAIDFKRGCTRAAEPGAFTKGLSYFRGFRAIEKYVKDGGDLRRLYIGKIALEDLELLKSLPELRKPVLLPKSLRAKEQPSKSSKKPRK